MVQLLDTMSYTELVSFLARYGRASGSEAVALVGPGYSSSEAMRITELLTDYAALLFLGFTHRGDALALGNFRWRLTATRAEILGAVR